MNCPVDEDLVNRMLALNSKLNLLSPDLVYGQEERAEVQQKREILYNEIKRHRKNGHDGKPCPAVQRPIASRSKKTSAGSQGSTRQPLDRKRSLNNLWNQFLKRCGALYTANRLWIGIRQTCLANNIKALRCLAAWTRNRDHHRLCWFPFVTERGPLPRHFFRRSSNVFQMR
jgi:hypothetical protein